MSSASFVLKTVERCNINCSYCYFFNGIDDSFKYHPPYISDHTISVFVEFVKKAISSKKLEKVNISFHGGEPLMQKITSFRQMCTSIRAAISEQVKVVFTLQTNGLLLTNQWLDLLAEEQVHIGVSIDGTKEFHDKFRIDKQGRGTFDKVVEKLDLLSKHSYYKEKGFGVLCVLQPGMEGNSIYTCLSKDLKTEAIDFLIPDANYHHPLNSENLWLGELLIDLFDAWVKDDNPNIQIRYFKSILGMFFKKPSQIYGFGPADNSYPIITVSSDGQLGPVDEIRSCSSDLMKDNGSIYDTCYSELLKKKNIAFVHNSLERIPEDCHSCIWKNICSGGPIVTRYSSQNGFNNKSFFCEELKIFYRHVTEYLLNNGFSLNQMNEVLVP